MDIFINLVSFIASNKYWSSFFSISISQSLSVDEETSILTTLSKADVDVKASILTNETPSKQKQVHLA